MKIVAFNRDAEVLLFPLYRFVREARDVLFLGSPGVGKSFLAQALPCLVTTSYLSFMTHRHDFRLFDNLLALWYHCSHQYRLQHISGDVALTSGENCTMTQSTWLLESSRKLSRLDRRRESHPVTTVRPQLEPLEDRLSPTATSIGVAISITPNLMTFTAIETITATVTQQGNNTPITSGNVSFNANSQQGTATLDSNGQATFGVNLPLFAVALNQTLDVSFQGSPGADPSSFVTPVYLNLWNAVLPSQLTYGPPTTIPMSQSPSLGSTGGESDALFLLGIPVVAHYVDPGLIDSVAFNLYQFPV